MPAWKVLFIAVFACVCFALGMATVIAPLTLTADQSRWLWFAGLLLGTICSGTLFTLFLRREDRKAEKKQHRGKL